MFPRVFPRISVWRGEDSLPFEVELLVFDVTEGLTTHITDMLRLLMDQNVLWYIRFFTTPVKQTHKIDPVVLFFFFWSHKPKLKHLFSLNHSLQFLINWAEFWTHVACHWKWQLQHNWRNWITSWYRLCHPHSGQYNLIKVLRHMFHFKDLH